MVSPSRISHDECWPHQWSPSTTAEYQDLPTCNAPIPCFPWHFLLLRGWNCFKKKKWDWTLGWCICIYFITCTATHRREVGYEPGSDIETLLCDVIFKAVLSISALWRFQENASDLKSLPQEPEINLLESMLQLISKSSIDLTTKDPNPECSPISLKKTDDLRPKLVQPYPSARNRGQDEDVCRTNSRNSWRLMD